MAGHFGPLVPFVEAGVARGDAVLVVVPEAAAERARTTGAQVVPGGSPDPDELARLWRDFRAAPPREASVIANREVFGRLNTAAMLPAVERAVAQHRPDVVVHEPTEYAGPIAAMRAGIRHAQVAISLAEVEGGSLTVAAPALARYGPVVDALRAAPYLTRFPAPIDPSPYPDTRRYQDPAAAAQPLPDWWNGSTDPLVYVTFGTVAGTVGTGAYRAATEALADEPLRVLMSTGQDLDLGPMPRNVHVCRWIAQADALAEASAVVCHGGSGTALGALAAGVPMVVHAMFADQLHNARALHGLGVAVVVDPAGATAAQRSTYDPAAAPALRAAVWRCLHDAHPREAARRIARELARRPTVEAALASLR
jgi:hypothetical protein